MSNPSTYQVVQILDEIPPPGRGINNNPELKAVKDTAVANPGRYVEITTNTKNVTALSGKGFKFVKRGDRSFVIYNNGTKDPA